MVQHTIGGCEVDCHSHVDVPAILEVVYEVGLLDNREMAELDRAGHHRPGFFIDQLSTLIFVFTRLALDLGAGKFDRSVEKWFRVWIALRVEAEAERVVVFVIT